MKIGNDTIKRYSPYMMHQEFDASKDLVFGLSKTGLDTWGYRLVDGARFVEPYDADLRNDICDLYAEYAGGILYDGPTVNLEGVGEPDELGRRELSLSLGGFYDFVCCNIIGREAANKDKRLQRNFKMAGASSEIMDMVETLGKRYMRERERIKDFAGCIRGSKLPNTIAVSGLVLDEEGNALLSRRTDSVIIAKQLYGTTCTGSVELGDIMQLGKRGKLFIPDNSSSITMDPFCASAMRELIEETTLQLPSSCFELRGLAIGRSKLQPIAIIDVHYHGVFRDGYKMFDPLGDQPDAEIAKVVAVPRERLAEMPKRYPMTEAAAYHIGLHVKQSA